MTNYRWNNFPGWFRNGYKRPFVKDDRGHRLIADLDRVLEEQGFDLQGFYELEDGHRSRFQEYTPMLRSIYRDEKREPTKEEQARLNELSALDEEYYNQLDALLEPVVKRMKELGYTGKELCS